MFDLAIDHWLTLSTSCCKVRGSDLPTLTSSERALSSTYLYKSSSLAKSFTMIRKNRGPSLVPCGTPALTVLQFDLQFCNLTRCCPSERKLAHQFNSTGGTLSNFNLCTECYGQFGQTPLKGSNKFKSR